MYRYVLLIFMMMVSPIVWMFSLSVYEMRRLLTIRRDSISVKVQSMYPCISSLTKNVEHNTAHYYNLPNTSVTVTCSDTTNYENEFVYTLNVTLKTFAYRFDDTSLFLTWLEKSQVGTLSRLT